jgi:hypothetical protein
MYDTTTPSVYELLRYDERKHKELLQGIVTILLRRAKADNLMNVVVLLHSRKSSPVWGCKEPKWQIDLLERLLTGAYVNNR